MPLLQLKRPKKHDMLAVDSVVLGRSMTAGVILGAMLKEEKLTIKMNGGGPFGTILVDVKFEGKVVGHHDGLMYYTIGQRRGLGIGGDGDPWFVIGKAIERNVLYVGQGFHHEMLYSDSLMADHISWISKESIPDTFQCMAKFRYCQQDYKVTVERLNESKVKVTFDEPIRAIAPGQAVVFYQGEECLGGGTINQVYRDNKQLTYVG